MPVRTSHRVRSLSHLRNQNPLLDHAEHYFESSKKRPRMPAVNCGSLHISFRSRLCEVEPVFKDGVMPFLVDCGRSRTTLL